MLQFSAHIYRRRGHPPREDTAYRIPQDTLSGVYLFCLGNGYFVNDKTIYNCNIVPYVSRDYVINAQDYQRHDYPSWSFKAADCFYPFTADLSGTVTYPHTYDVAGWTTTR